MAYRKQIWVLSYIDRAQIQIEWRVTKKSMSLDFMARLSVLGDIKVSNIVV